MIGRPCPSVETVERIAAAERLDAAIADCHPSDATTIMTAALEDLSAGFPLPAFLDATEDAELWAAAASPAEVEAYLTAALDRAFRGPFPRAARDRISAKISERIGGSDRPLRPRHGMS